MQGVILPVPLTEYLGIDKVAFDKTGAFDPVLDVDTRLFIDPFLLQKTSVPEFKSSYSTLQKHYKKIIKLVSHISNMNPADRFYKEADKLIDYRELWSKGLCIGYSRAGINGSGIGPELRAQILQTAKTIYNAGIDDPEIFDLVGLFEEGIGCDRISDMVAKIIFDDILSFSQRVFEKFKVNGELFQYGDKQIQLPVNRLCRSRSKPPILLVPKEILRNLPTALTWGSVDFITTENEQLRAKVNELIGTTWKDASNMPKRELKAILLSTPILLKELLKAYKVRLPDFYDYEGDPAGQVIWLPAAKEATSLNPLVLELAVKPTIDDIYITVLKICEKFKELLEDNNLSKLLYYKGKPKHEEAAQLLFFGICEMYCEANNLDITRESNGGRGPVDFKISSGYRERVVVEVKLTTNPQLIHGFEKQLPIYQQSEKTKKGIYLVIDVGASEKKLKKFTETVNKAKSSTTNCPHVILIDGNLRLSASKAK